MSDKFIGVDYGLDGGLVWALIEQQDNGDIKVLDEGTVPTRYLVFCAFVREGEDYCRYHGLPKKDTRIVSIGMGRTRLYGLHPEDYRVHLAEGWDRPNATNINERMDLREHMEYFGWLKNVTTLPRRKT